MKFKIRFADQIVGFFILVAIFAMAVIFIFIGINQRWFARNYSFRSRFESGAGLAAGLPIVLKGFEIGKISRISLNDQNQVDVVFSVQDTYYDRVLPNSVLELTSSPIGLGVTLKFHPGLNAGPPLPEDSFIPSLDIDEGAALRDAGLVDIPKDADVIGSVIAKLNPVLDEIRTTVTQTKKLIANVDAAFSGEGGPMGEMVADLSQTPAKLNATITDVTRRVNAVMDSIDATMANLEDVSLSAKVAVEGLTADIGEITLKTKNTISSLSTDLGDIASTTKGTIGTLSVSLGDISADIKATTEDLRNTRGLVTRLLDPKGSIDTILNDQNALFNQIEAALASANDIIVQVGSFVDYINSTKPQISSILEKGKDTLDEGKDVLTAVKNNPLLKGGVPARVEQGATLKSYRDEDF